MMIKKTIATVALLGVGAVALFGTRACSYSKTLFGNVRDAVQSEIEPEFKLDSIRHEVTNLMPEIRQHMKLVAEQVVEVRNLQADISQKQVQLDGQRASILALRSDLDSGRSEFQYRQVSYTRGEVETDLADRFTAYQLLEASLDRDTKILKATKETLKANQRKLDAMMSRKQDLAVRVSQAEARLKSLQATETINALEVDDTQLSRVEEALNQLNHDLDVREALLETQGHILGRIPVEEVDVQETDVLTDIDQHFGLTESLNTTDLASASEL